MKKYDIVYADPPWKQTKGGLRKARLNQKKDLDYPVLDINNIKNILKKFDSKILFIWTIDKFLIETEELIKELGFNLHARIIWNKLNGVAPAFTVRFSHEYLLWCYKRPMLKINKNFRGKYTTVLTEKSTKHSKKPICAYEMIENFYPNYSKIELFARNKRVDWDCWGNEVDSDIEIL